MHLSQETVTAEPKGHQHTCTNTNIECHHDNNVSSDSDHSDSDCDCDCSAEEGLMFLLGGLSTETMACTDWTVPEEDHGTANDGISRDDSHSNSTTAAAAARTYHHHTTEGLGDNDNDNDNDNGEEREIYKRAFRLSPTAGQALKPPVKVLNLSSERRGNILIATESIPKGQVIFTERALEAAQVPFGHCAICQLQPGPTTSKASVRGLYTVRACQHCFQSLEPASSLSNTKDDDGDDDDATTRTIPLSELWPVPEYVYDSQPQLEDSSNGNTYTSSNKPLHASLDSKRGSGSGRMACHECGAIFCSHSCANSHRKIMGNCCICTRAIQGLIHASCCCRDKGADVDVDLKNSSDEGGSVQNEEEQQQQEDGEQCEPRTTVDIDPVIVLAARMFIAQVQLYRTNNNGAGSTNLFHGLCGEEDDIPLLRLGSIDIDDDETIGEDTYTYALKNEYEAIAHAIGLTESERSSKNSPFSLRRFHRMAAVAQRNAISLTTGSPFQTYYQAMIRNTGGRGSSRQKQVVSELARVLGSGDGTLSREMDRIVEEKVSG